VARVLVTGAAGFSGSRLVHALLERGHDVTAVVRRSSGNLFTEGRKSARLNLVTADLTQLLTLVDPVDAIVHTAATSPGKGVSATEIVRDNVIATAQLAAYALRCAARQFIFFSSLSLYGIIRQQQVDETTPICDPDVYGSTKFIGEALVRDLSGQGHCSAIMLRLPGLIGPASHRNWLSNVVEAARLGSEIAIYNPDAPFNNAIHVADLCRFVVDLIEHGWAGSDAITLGAGGTTTVRAAVETLTRALQSTSTVRIRSDAGQSSFTISSKRAAERYGYRPSDINSMLLRFAAENLSR